MRNSTLNLSVKHQRSWNFSEIGKSDIAWPPARRLYYIRAYLRNIYSKTMLSKLNPFWYPPDYVMMILSSCLNHDWKTKGFTILLRPPSFYSVVYSRLCQKTLPCLCEYLITYFSIILNKIMLFKSIHLWHPSDDTITWFDV